MAAAGEGEGGAGEGAAGDFTVAAPSSCNVWSLPTLETHLEIKSQNCIEIVEDRLPLARLHVEVKELISVVFLIVNIIEIHELIRVKFPFRVHF